MKPIALLTCGKSLTTTWADGLRSQYELVVAINHATRFACDVAISVDKVWEHKINNPYPLPESCKFVLWHPTHFKHLPCWEMSKQQKFTFPLALCWCLTEHKNDIHIYGCDMGGDGFDVHTSKPGRWTREIAQLEQVWDEKRITKVFGAYKHGEARPEIQTHVLDQGL